MKKTLLFAILFSIGLLVNAQSTKEVIAHLNNVKQINDEFATLWMEQGASISISNMSVNTFQQIITANQGTIEKLNSVEQVYWDEGLLDYILESHKTVQQIIATDKKIILAYLEKTNFIDEDLLSASLFLMKLNEKIISVNEKIAVIEKFLAAKYNFTLQNIDFNKKANLLIKKGHFFNQLTIILLNTKVEVTKFLRNSTNETYASALNNVLDGQAKIDNIHLVEGGTSIKENMMNYHNHFYDFLKKYGSDCISFYSTDLDKLDNTSKEAVERYNKLVVKRNEASDFYNQAVPIAEKHNILGQEFIQE